MTEVPDKQTEGTGVGRGTRGGRGRGRGRPESEPAAAAGGGSTRGRRGGTSTNGSGNSTVLPGERISGRSGSFSEADLASAEVFTLDDLGANATTADGPDAEGEAGESRDESGRRRRRRGGRGRGRGRGRDETPAVAGAPVNDSFDEDQDEEDETPIEAPRPRSTPFGSVWDSQLGTTAAPANLTPPSPEDEDFDEPEIPEYLIAEQRRGQGTGGRGGGRGPRGGRSAYQSAIERERYGGGRTGGINRYPDVSGRTTPSGNRGSSGRNYDRPNDRRREPARPASSAEPWSEVPPELEAMLRAQVGQKTSRPSDVAPSSNAKTIDAVEAEAIVLEVGGTDITSSAEAAAATTAAPKRRTTRKATSSAGADAAPDGEAAGSATPKRRTTRKTTASSADGETSQAAAPKRRASRPKAATADSTAPAVDAVPTGDAPTGEAAAKTGSAPKRRTTRKTTKTAS